MVYSAKIVRKGTKQDREQLHRDKQKKNGRGSSSQTTRISGARDGRASSRARTHSVPDYEVVIDPQTGAHIIQSSGGIVYYIDEGQPKYLLIKRFALSKKIERVCPKGKVDIGEDPAYTALREVSEETGLNKNHLIVQDRIGTTILRNDLSLPGLMNKDTSYYLIHYTGDPSTVDVIDGEGYVGMFKWYTLQDVLGLIYYPDMRELVRKSYFIITDRLAQGTIHTAQSSQPQKKSPHRRPHRRRR